jgi:predicted dehydrogenase
MKQLLQNLGDGKTVVEEIPIPIPLVGTALIKTAASLVSAGTERMVVEFAGKSLVGKARSRPDLLKQVLEKARREGLISSFQTAFNRLDQPMALGYSSAGTITALGSNMKGYKVGDRVACAGGGYAVHAEYAVVPRNLLSPLPSKVDFESAAFATLGAIAMHGFRLAEPRVGEHVAVIGLGLLGLLTAQIASAAGCEILGIDIDPKRIALASSLGLRSTARQNAIHVSEAFTSNRGFDLIIICADTTSNDPVELAGIIARDRARVVATGAVGLTIPRKIYYEKELSFINSRSYGPGRYDATYEEEGKDYPIGYVRWTEGRNLEAVIKLMATSKLLVKPLITHRFPIEKAPQAYDVITGKKKAPFLGVLITYHKSNVKLKESGVVNIRRGEHKPLKKVALGVLGAGLYANATLLPVIKRIKDVEFIGIASSGGLHAKISGKKFGFEFATSSDDKIINDPNINTIAILTRHDTHAALVIKGLKAGKNIFVEKPLAINKEQLSAVQKQLYKENNGILTVGYNRRFSPFARQLSYFYSGRVEAMHIHYRVNAGRLPLNHWTQDPNIGGGRIIGEACHFIDFVTFLVGAPPVSVTALALPDKGKYSEDNVSMSLIFPDGSIGVVDYLANGDKSFPKERVEVFCGGKVAVLDDFRALEMVEEGNRKKIKGPQNKGWNNEWNTFVEAIRDGKQPPIPYEQIIGVTKASFAVIESLRNSSEVRLA